MHFCLKIIWRTQKDEHVCPVCKALEGYTWSVNLGESYPKQLIHPLFGAVYDNRSAAKCSVVKEEQDHICRCTLEHQFEVAPKTENAVAVKCASK